MKMPDRVDVIGSRISACDMDSALQLLEERMHTGDGGYVCFTNVHMSVVARQEEAIRSITNGSFLSLADGKPIYWAGRAKGCREIGHVPGPDFFGEALKRFPQAGHFFYGSKLEVLSQFLAGVQRISPGIRICGSLSPPFRALTATEKQEHYRTIRESGAALIWIGLGAPKQEQWMAEAWPHLRSEILLGVGAAFDFYAGSVRRAPRHINRMGLEWLYRLFQEPRRLWRRYLVTNTLFIFYVLRDLLLGIKEPRK